MRICIVGKYPPIQGGVSVLNYANAQALASLGHQVHVVTNAKEVEPEFRIMMRNEDWARCECDNPSGGYVRVHWTAADYGMQGHIPWHNPYVTKLASLAADAIRQHDLELVVSSYLEPYAVAGYLAAQMTNLPHVVRTAGSDVGRLLLHPQLGPLYQHILTNSRKLFTSPVLYEQLTAEGLPEAHFGNAINEGPLPDFTPQGPCLDLAQLLEEMAALPHSPVLPTDRVPPGPYIGIYGKQSEIKGTFDLLHAAARLRRQGRRFGILIVGRSRENTQQQLAKTISALELSDTVLQLPFLPPWRIPAFLQRCRAVCYLERDFPIPHGPIVPREVLACGRPLVASAEKLMLDHVLDGHIIHRYNCLAVRNVRDPEELASHLDELLTNQPLADQIGQRGHEVSIRVEAQSRFPANLEAAFAEVLGDVVDPGSDETETLGSDLVERIETDETRAQQTAEALLYRFSGESTLRDVGCLYPTILSDVDFVDGLEGPSPVAVVRSRSRLVATQIRAATKPLIESLDGSKTIVEIADDVASVFNDDESVRQTVHNTLEHYFRLGLIALRSHPASLTL